MDSRVLEKKLKFIDNYKKASNAATGSQFDANANVVSKNIATLQTELGKKDLIDLNRALTKKYITQLYDEELASQYDEDLRNHIIYRNDESSIFPYCCSISLYPFLLNGLKDLGGSSGAPQHANGFVGGLINLIFLVAGQFAGACLYKDQKLIVRINGIPYSVTSKNLFEMFNQNQKHFSTLTDTWDYCEVNNVEIFEDGKWIKLNKVMRRPYNDDIYNIKTKGGLSVMTSKDHKYKVLYKNRDFTIKSNELKINDTVYANRDLELIIDKDSDDYKIGQIIGLIAGDGSINNECIRISINTDQLFIAEFLDLNLHLLFDKYNINEPVHTRQQDSRTDKVISYYVGSTNISTVIKSYFKNNCYNTFTKDVDLEDKSLNWQLGFLDGLLTADGCYSKGHTLRLTLTNKSLLDTVKKILNNIFLDTNITSYSNSKKPNNHVLYSCYIPVSCYNLLNMVLNKPCYSSMIEYLSREKHNNTKTTYYSGPTSGILKSKICSIRDSKQYNLKSDVITHIETFKNDDGYVYEVETESHWYNCGGLITHNCAVPETLTYFDYFIRKDYGNDYIQHLDEGKYPLRHQIEDWFQQLVYSINQPAGARNYQSPFTNIAYFDKYYFESIFKDFVFPDGDEPCWETTKELQKMFMKWFNKERTKEILTFPVETANLLVENGKYKDNEMADFFAEQWAEGHSFFMYQSDSVDSLSSCCRLRNNIEENIFSYTLGAGGIETGSKCVITLNLNRIIQNWFNDEINKKYKRNRQTLSEYLTPIIERVHKYLTAWNQKLWDDFNDGILTVYSAGFIDLDKQYLTVGINGVVEAAEFLQLMNDYVPNEYKNIKIHPNNNGYKYLATQILGTIKNLNKKDRTEHTRFNTECVPGENLSAKFYNWDKKDGYVVPKDRVLYNSYFYIVEDPTISPVDKFYYQGTGFATECDGGVALHNNLAEHLSKEQYRKLMDIAVKAGCNYWTYNIPNTICNDCGHIDKRMLHECPVCGSKNIDYATRIIGYLKRISNFSEVRQIEASKRYYAHIGEDCDA